MRVFLVLACFIQQHIMHVQSDPASKDIYNDLSGPIVDTPLGLIEGVRLSSGRADGGVEAFLGIPFAQAPVGELRFTKPLPFATPWPGTFKAVEKRPGCPQADQWLSNHLRLVYSNRSSEDCLALNIWRPAATTNRTSSAQATPKPVFVFIYGGSFQWGSSDLFLYDGRAFAASTGTIFVSVSYRVGLLGFAHHRDLPELTGTAGLWDQNLALRWIHDHISHFGGDPTQVTVCGHSAGAISAALHAISPHAKGLFQRVILQSGTSLSLSTLSRIPRNELSKVAERIGCSGEPQDQLDCLRAINAMEIVQVADQLGHEGMALPPLESDYASLDPAALDHADFNVNQLIIGTNEHEATIFARRALYSNDRLRSLISGVGHMVSLVGLLRTVFHTPLSESRQIVTTYFPEEREYTEAEMVQLVSEAATDLFFACPAQFYAKAATASGVMVYRYLFRHRPSYSLYEDIPGVLHGEELPFTLGNLQILKELLREDRVTVPDSTVMNLTYTRREEKLLREVQHLWGSFVRDGEPTLRSGKAWPPFTASRELFLEISTNALTARRGLPSTERCPVWEKIVMQRVQSQRAVRMDDSADESGEELSDLNDLPPIEAVSVAAREDATVFSILLTILPWIVVFI